MRGAMTRTNIGRSTTALLLAATFGAGYLVGTVTAEPAVAGLGDMVEQAAKSGALGPAGDLGTAIVDMQEHVDGLEANLETLRKVKAALGG